MLTIPAITLWQPWASWIAVGLKTIETRGHQRFRCLVGQVIAIHAGLRWDGHAYATAAAYRPVSALTVQEPEHGSVVALARVGGFRELDAADAPAALCPCGPGRYGLILEHVERLAVPQPARSGQGIWRWQVDDALTYVRDPDYPCGQFFEGKPGGDCQGDGHYLCRECMAWCPEDEADEQEA